MLVHSLSFYASDIPDDPARTMNDLLRPSEALVLRGSVRGSYTYTNGGGRIGWRTWRIAKHGMVHLIRGPLDGPVPIHRGFRDQGIGVKMDTPGRRRARRSPPCGRGSIVTKAKAWVPCP